MDRTGEARPPHEATTPRADQELLDAVRAGDSAAYGDLWSRHSDAARRLAAAIAPASDVDDVVSESFTRVLRAINGGGGPETAFRPYLLSAVRRVVIDTGRSYNNRVLPTDDEADLDRPDEVGPADKVEQREQETIALAAWTSLPEESQALLWHLLVEGETPAQLAPIFGTSANGVSSRAKRAKEKLRLAFLNEYTVSTVDPECRRVRHRLGTHTRGMLPTKQSRNLRAHLRRCRECRGAFLVVADTNAAMRALVAPGLLGGTVVVGKYLLGAGAVAKGGALLLGGGAAHSSGWALWPPPGLSSPGRVAAAGGATAAAVAVAVAAFALTGSPSTPRHDAAPTHSSATSTAASTTTGSSSAAQRSSTSSPSTSTQSSPSKPIAVLAPSSTSSTSSTSTVTQSPTHTQVPTPTSPGAPPSSHPTSPRPPRTTPPPKPTPPPSTPPPARATTLRYSMAIGPESDASVAVSSGWQLVSITDGAGDQLISTPTRNFSGTVSGGNVTVTVRSTDDPARVGSLTGVFSPTHGLPLPRIMIHVLQPAD